jgi:hypothetical protein
MSLSVCLMRLECLKDVSEMEFISNIQMETWFLWNVVSESLVCEMRFFLRVLKIEECLLIKC